MKLHILSTYFSGGGEDIQNAKYQGERAVGPLVLASSSSALDAVQQPATNPNGCTKYRIVGTERVTEPRPGGAWFSILFAVVDVGDL